MAQGELCSHPAESKLIPGAYIITMWLKEYAYKFIGIIVFEAGAWDYGLLWQIYVQEVMFCFIDESKLAVLPGFIVNLSCSQTAQKR